MQIPEEWALEVDCLWKSGGWAVRTMAGNEKWVPETFAAIDTYGSQTLFRVEELKEAREWLSAAHDEAVRKVKRGIWDELKVHFNLDSLTAARGVQDDDWGRRPRHCTHQTKLYGADGKIYLWLATDFTTDRGFFLDVCFPDDPWATEATDQKSRMVRGVVDTAYGRDPW
jgi:hypothetical protein